MLCPAFEAVLWRRHALPARRCTPRLRGTLGRHRARGGQALLGWRCVPTDDSELGQTAVLGEPYVRQVFIGRNLDGPLEDDLAFERKLYVIRKRAEQAIRYGDVPGGDRFYMPSLSCRTIVYKGMLLPEQMTGFYQDLSEPDVESALALVHSRFSTNTFPSWERAHPYRYLIHNGEINTLRGNINWMHARQSTFVSEAFGDDLAKVLPVINQDGSDSAMFDEALEFLYLAGRSLPHVMMMMIPEPWSNHATMPDDKKAFYEYHSTLMEPWDGPASIGFTDGTVVGAVLDRSSLRPSRYYVTKDGLVIMASEVGVLDIEPSRVLKKGRLEPGRMFWWTRPRGASSTTRDQARHGRGYPYRAWLDESLTSPWTICPTRSPCLSSITRRLLHRQKAFGYTAETPQGAAWPPWPPTIEPVGAMGNDTRWPSCRTNRNTRTTTSKQAQLCPGHRPAHRRHQELVTATEVMMGTERLLDGTPLHCRRIKLKTPILTSAGWPSSARSTCLYPCLDALHPLPHGQGCRRVGAGWRSCTPRRPRPLTTATTS
ncbi:MAG: glutamate synthase central domain-containing protein [Caldilineaceae bacterium]